MQASKRATDKVQTPRYICDGEAFGRILDPKQSTVSMASFAVACNSHVCSMRWESECILVVAQLILRSIFMSSKNINDDEDKFCEHDVIRRNQ